MKKFNIFLSAFLSLILVSLSVQAGLFDKHKSAFLTAEDAFQLEVQRIDEQHLLARWKIAEGYYLYQNKIEFALNEQQSSFEPASYDKAAKEHQDPYFGTMMILTEDVNASVQSKTSLQESDVLLVSYQGCTEGLCYPPEVKTFKIGELPTATVSDEDNQVSKTAGKTTALNHSSLSEQDSLAATLFQSKYAMFWFFLLGLGLAFTPCVLPMLPLLSAIVIGSSQRPSTARAFTLSFIYVQGMAFTYTLLGLIVVAIGLPFQIALQSPYMMVGLSLVFVLLALSMFGVFTLQLPSSLQTKLTLFSQKQKSGAFGGVFLMGMIAGLVSSPCTSAPLSGALLYVAQSGDFITGAFTLYLLALGMGVPLILITVFGNKLLPKTGMWMEKVKQAFGFVMLALPVFLLSRIMPETWELRLWAILGTAFFIWLALQIPKDGIGQFFRIAFLMIAMICVTPLQTWLWHGTETEQKSIKMEQSVAKIGPTSVHQTKFKRIKNYQELETELANNPHAYAMLDLYADWCVACKEFEKYTFQDKNVQQSFQQILLLQVDMTENSEENQELMQKLNILGLPTIVFFDKQGNEILGSRVTGFMPAIPFNEWLKNIMK